MASYFPLVASPATPLTSVSAKPGFWRRVLDRLIEAQHRRAEREIARYIHLSGSFTDSVEREIERRYMSNPSRPV